MLDSVDLYSDSLFGDLVCVVGDSKGVARDYYTDVKTAITHTDNDINYTTEYAGLKMDIGQRDVLPFSVSDSLTSADM